jgi:hypothetical protein
MVRLEAVPEMYQKTRLAPLQSPKLKKISFLNHRAGFTIQNCWINMYRVELHTMQPMKTGIELH